MGLERDTCGVADREPNAVRQLHLLEPISGHFDTRRREVYAGGARRSSLSQREEQPAAPATELEQRPAGWSNRKKRISETLRDRNQDRILASRQALGYLGVEMPSDPRIGGACALLPLLLGGRIDGAAFMVIHPDIILQGEQARRLRSKAHRPLWRPGSRDAGDLRLGWGTGCAAGLGPASSESSRESSCTPVSASLVA